MFIISRSFAGSHNSTQQKEKTEFKTIINKTILGYYKII